MRGRLAARLVCVTTRNTPKPSDPWKPLFEAGLRPNVSERDEIRWVAAYLFTSLDLIPLEGVPSLAAVTMLRVYREAPALFFDKMYSKVIPSREDINRLSKGDDGGSALDDHLETVAAAAAAAGATS